MDLRRLQYFLAIVDAGTITAAAEQLRVAQPALSRQVKTLERELRLRLFEPQGNRLSLTSAGRALVPVARRLMVESRGFEQAAIALRNGRVDELVVATTSASLRSFVAPFIATTGPGDPIIIPREISHFNMADSLRSGCDFAISPTAPDGSLHHLPLGQVAIKAFVSLDHPWARAGVTELPITEFAGCSAIVTSHQSVSRYILDDALSRAGVALDGIRQCDDGQSVVALAAAGHGVGFVTERPLYGAHAVVVLGLESGGSPRPLGLPLHVAWLPGHYAELEISKIARRIRRFLKDEGITFS